MVDVHSGSCGRMYSYALGPGGTPSVLLTGERWRIGTASFGLAHSRRIPQLARGGRYMASQLSSNEWAVWDLERLDRPQLLASREATVAVTGEGVAYVWSGDEVRAHPVAGGPSRALARATRIAWPYLLARQAPAQGAGGAEFLCLTSTGAELYDAEGASLCRVEIPGGLPSLRDVVATLDLSRVVVSDFRRSWWLDLQAARAHPIVHKGLHTLWWSPDGERLLTASNDEVLVWTDPAAPPLEVFQAGNEDDDSILGANWSLDGRRLWITLSGRVLEHDLEARTQREVHRGDGRYYDPQSLAQGGLLVTEILPAPGEAPSSRPTSRPTPR